MLCSIVFELWFKQILFEIDSIQNILIERSHSQVIIIHMFNINNRLNRCTQIWNILHDQLQLLETMTPIQFLEFRDYITPASGFQSLQFRKIEFKLGLDNELRRHFKEKHFTQVMFKGKQAEELERTSTEMSLFALLEVSLLKEVRLDAYNTM